MVLKTPTNPNYNQSLYIDDYIKFINPFKNLPYQQKVLMNAGKTKKRVSLPSIDTSNLLTSLPKINKQRIRSQNSV